MLVVDKFKVIVGFVIGFKIRVLHVCVCVCVVCVCVCVCVCVHQ